MNPQCGYYQSSQRQQNYGALNTGSGCYGGGAMGASGRQGGRTYSSVNKSQPNQSRSTYGYCGQQGSRTRAPPVFPSSGYPAQTPSCNRTGNGFRQQQQQATRPIPVPKCNYKMGYQQPQQCSNQHVLAPAPFCTPQAIKVNITAEQLENANNTPFQARGDPSLEGNTGVKYIQLNWQDLLGGMENLRVSMAPSADPNNQNQQLKVSFGGQKTDPPHAGEQSLKVIAIEPANSGRMDIQKGNALAGSMKICNSPITNISPTPTSCPTPRTQAYFAANNQKTSCRGSCQ